VPGHFRECVKEQAAKTASEVKDKQRALLAVRPRGACVAACRGAALRGPGKTKKKKRKQREKDKKERKKRGRKEEENIRLTSSGTSSHPWPRAGLGVDVEAIIMPPLYLCIENR
jgi:hypothetical protein